MDRFVRNITCVKGVVFLFFLFKEEKPLTYKTSL